MTKEDLDKVVAEGCADPTCTDPHHDEPMVLTSVCHPAKGIKLVYYDGVLTAECYVCGKFVENFQVANS